MVHRLLTLSLSLAMFATAGAADKNTLTGKGRATQLEGEYTVVTGQRHGKNLPDEEVRGSKVRFTRDEVIGTDRNSKKIFVAKYKLDTSKTPWHIHMTSVAPDEGQKAEGLVEKQSNDTMRIVYNLPGGEVPTDFKAGAKQQMFILKSYPEDRDGGKRRP